LNARSQAGTAAPAVRVAADPAALTLELATGLERLIAAAAQPPFTLALAGGATPRRLYETLAAPPFKDRLAWDRLELFFGDERAVPPEHPDSNYGMVARALLERVAVRAHRMAAETGDTEAYARLLDTRVAGRLEGVPALDLVLLGMGEDGHTASLFPGTSALAETRRWVVMNEVPQLATRRMTLTFPVINAARHVWVLVTGAAKRAIVTRCLAAAAAGGDVGLPVTCVRPARGELVWWLDRAAAGETATS
jgi:6-phosphogluconolactonase